MDVYPALLGSGHRAALQVVISGVFGLHLYGTDACRGTYLPDAALEALLRPAGGTVGLRPAVGYRQNAVAGYPVECPGAEGKGFIHITDNGIQSRAAAEGAVADALCRRRNADPDQALTVLEGPGSYLRGTFRDNHLPETPAVPERPLADA